jgi:hypothetical protein
MRESLRILKKICCVVVNFVCVALTQGIALDGAVNNNTGVVMSW